MSTHQLPNRSDGLSASELEALRHAGTNYAWANSLMFRRPSNLATPEAPTHVPFCLFPSPFPRDQFERAIRLQTAYNRLYLNIASDPQLIREVIGSSIAKVDPFESFEMIIFFIKQNQVILSKLSRLNLTQSVSALVV